MKNKTKKKQYGGISPHDVITTENRDRHIGRFVKIILLDNTNDTDLFGSYFVRELVDHTFKIINSNPFREFTLDDNFIALESVGNDYDEEILLNIPSRLLDILYNKPYLVKLITGSNISSMFTIDNITRLNEGARDRRRRRRLTLTEHPAETSTLPLYSDRRSDNPLPFSSTVTLNTINGPLDVNIPLELLKIIASHI